MGNVESQQSQQWQPADYRNTYPRSEVIIENKKNIEIGMPFIFEEDGDRCIHLHTSIPDEGPIFQVAYDSLDVTDPHEESCYSYSMSRHEDLTQFPTAWTAWTENIGRQWRF
jgi:hypothetical protein